MSGPARVPDPFDGPQEMSVAGGELGAGGVRQLPDPSDADAIRGVVHAQSCWLGPFAVHHVDVPDATRLAQRSHQQLDAPVSGIVRVGKEHLDLEGRLLRHSGLRGRRVITRTRCTT